MTPYQMSGAFLKDIILILSILVTSVEIPTEHPLGDLSILGFNLEILAVLMLVYLKSGSIASVGVLE